KPVPQAGEVLVKVAATTVNFGDIMARRFSLVDGTEFNMPAILLLLARLYFGYRKPKINILGSEFSGIVEATGDGVFKLQPGDRVFGYCGQKMGSYAEYLVIAEKDPLALVPDNYSMEEAASMAYGPLMALHLFRKVQLSPGQKVLVLGAGGSIGSAWVQMARNSGAYVTAVCSSRKADYVRKLGAQQVVCYELENWYEQEERYDLILDVLGKSTIAQVRKGLNKKGTYLAASFKLGKIVHMFWSKLIGGKRFICALAPGSRADFLDLQQQMADGKLSTIIDRVFPLDEAAAAHQYVEQKLDRGKVVLRVQD
ncbi:MAG: NAD(P)-dependent alcohol dehydrogenase, partial [Prolixibacteraceae bacterium]|nr:NAD(P)-dependent alcohol dehydrogenase [Prolixibacteraceae bacterium]